MGMGRSGEEEAAEVQEGEEDYERGEEVHEEVDEERGEGSVSKRQGNK
jgi:hypothetical protein